MKTGSSSRGADWQDQNENSRATAALFYTKDLLSITEKELIRKLVKYFRGRLKGRPLNSILMLTGNKLLNRLFGLEHVREEINSKNLNPDDVG